MVLKCGSIITIAKKDAKNIKKFIIKNGGKAEIIKFDVSNEKEFVDSIRYIYENDGFFHYLVNNAGITKDTLLFNVSTNDFKKVIDTNLISTFIGIREGSKYMRMSKFGSIVNISSIVGETGNAGQASYTASKAGILALTKTAAQELSPLKIRVNAITPGLTNTDMVESIPELLQQKFKANIPMKRFSDVNEIANGVLFLLSDNASYITGETLKINGGLNMA